VQWQGLLPEYCETAFCPFSQDIGMNNRTIYLQVDDNSDRGDPSVAQYRQVVFPIIVIHPAGQVDPIGTCFVISCIGKHAVVMTAKHNIEEIIRLDGYKSASASSTPKEFRFFENKDKEAKNIQMYIAYSPRVGTMIPCEILQACFPEEGHDIAVAIIRIPDVNNEVFSHRFEFDSLGPNIGDAVQAIGYGDMRPVNRVTDANGLVISESLDIPLTSANATVLARHGHNGHHFVKWPCVELGCSIKPGMSGGPIISAQANGSVVVRGVVTSGTTFSDEGVGSLIYPIMPMTINMQFPTMDSESPKLMDLARKKIIVDVARSYHFLDDDGSWRTFPVARFKMDNLTEFQPEGATMFDLKDSAAWENRFAGLSSECVQLGTINAHNGDNAQYILISLEFHKELIKAEQETGGAPVAFVAARTPYIWLKIWDAEFRLFVFELKLDESHSIKILTDCHKESFVKET
jgi:hypothetical protein